MSHEQKKQKTTLPSVGPWVSWLFNRDPVLISWFYLGSCSSRKYPKQPAEVSSLLRTHLVERFQPTLEVFVMKASKEPYEDDALFLPRKGCDFPRRYTGITCSLSKKLQLK